MRAGIECIYLGLVPTSLVYFAAHQLDTGSAVAITGSHNPPEYNGFKMMLGGKTLYGEDITALHRLMEQPAENAQAPAINRVYDPIEDYLSEIGRAHV